MNYFQLNHICVICIFVGPKPGYCERKDMTTEFSIGRTCETDFDCNGNKKCCGYGIDSTLCVEPKPHSKYTLFNI